MNPLIEIALKAPNGVKCITTSLNESNSEWTYEHNINNWIGRNLPTQFFKDSVASFICYNDEVPDHCDGKNSQSFGHAKGILIWNEKNIYWLVHSVPKWPLIEKVHEHDNTYCCCFNWNRFLCNSLSIVIPEIPSSESKYGQSFILLCTPFSFSLLSSIFEQLSVMHVNIYQKNHDESIHYDNKISCLKNLSILKITNKIRHFAKSPHLHEDFYELLLNEIGSDNCLVESWMRPAMQESEKIHHIKSIFWRNRDDNVNFIETKDHSKWAIQEKDDCKVWILVGDLNRMESQKKRGGGGIWIQDRELWKAFQLLCTLGKNEVSPPPSKLI
jgi:deoxyribonuclease-2